MTPLTVPSPICLKEKPCPRQGRAVLGPKVPSGDDCVNQTVTCQTCGKVGRLSTNLRALKLR